jgi:hypothetical protein
MKNIVEKKQVSLKGRLKEVDKAFGITPEANKRAVDTEYVIDCNKRTHMNDKPRLTE